VRSEALGAKTLVHNYGHGGGGVTLSWGTGHLAVELAQVAGSSHAAVIGCGAVGLATARLLQRRGFDVTIYARDLPPSTTSNIAGATWFPSSVADADRRTAAFDTQFARAARLSYRYFQNLVGDYYGVRWMEQYNLSDEPIRPSWEQQLMADFLPPEEPLLERDHPFAVPYANRWMTMLIEPPVYLNAVMQDFLVAGGRLVVREFARGGELADLPEPVIVNCTGLGAATLAGDPELLPIKGQLSALLPQPEIDYIYGAPGDIYLIPRRDGLMLGGTHQRGESTLEPDSGASARILEGHIRLMKDLRV
jgi:glycine/D-amino acid oxidase-like deaminating enzyme